MPLQFECKNGCFGPAPFACAHGGSATGGTTLIRAGVELLPLPPFVLRERVRQASAQGQAELWKTLEVLHREQPIEDAGLHRVSLRVPVPEAIRHGWIPDVARAIEHAVNTH